MSKLLSRSHMVLALASIVAVVSILGLIFSYLDSPPRQDDGPVAVTAADGKTGGQPDAADPKDGTQTDPRPPISTKTNDKASSRPAEIDAASKSGQLASAGADQQADPAKLAARIQMIRQLRNEKTEEAVQTLEGFLADENPAVVFASLNSLAYIGKDSHLEDRVFGVLLDKSGDPEFSGRGQALIIAAMFGRDEQIMPVISDYIDAPDDDEGAQKRHAARALAVIASPECVDSLKLILAASNDIATKRSVLDTLSRIDSPEATQILEQTLYEGYSEDQLESIRALAVRNKSEYNQILLDAMLNRSLDEPAIAVVASNPAGPVLLKEMLNRADISGEEKTSLLKIYADNMTRTNEEGRSGIVEAVQPLVNDSDDRLSLEAIRILGMGFGPEETAEILNTKFESSNQQIRRAALDAYLPYLTEDNYKPLLDLIWDEDESIRRQAIMVSQQYIDESDLPILEKALKHEDEAIRESASIMIKKYKTN